MAKKFNNIIHKTVILFMVLVLIVIFGILASNHTTKVYANTNRVYFKDLVVEANDSNLIIAEVVVSGNAGDDVIIKYHTESRTAIKGVDFNYVKNTASIKIDDSGVSTFRISIKCINDRTNIEKLRLYETKAGNDIVYGRYFNLILDDASNATLDEEKISNNYNDLTDVMLKKEIEEDLKKMILELPMEYSPIIELRMNGFNYREIGVLLELPISSVEYRIRKIRKRVKLKYNKTI